MFKPRVYLSFLVVLMAPAAAAAADKDAAPLSRKDLDTRLYTQLRDTINAGRALYTNGDPAGCSRLYQGALMAIVPLLDHRPELKLSVVKGLQKAEQENDPVERAFAMREVIDEIRKTIRDDLGLDPAPGKTLWSRLGGEPVVGKVVHEMVTAAAADPKVNLDRGGKYKLDAESIAKLEKKLVEYISAQTGGPLKYSGPDMKAAHKGMGITDAEFTALATQLVKALGKHNVPQKETVELLDILAETRKDIVEAKSPEPPKETLWSRLGGEQTVRAVVHDFLSAAAGDAQVNFDRKGKFELDAKGMAHLEQLLVELISEVSQGPLRYSGKDLKSAHEGMSITEAEFDALAAHLSAAFKKHKVPQEAADQLLKIVGTTKPDIVEKKP